MRIHPPMEFGGLCKRLATMLLALVVLHQSGEAQSLGQVQGTPREACRLEYIRIEATLSYQVVVYRLTNLTDSEMFYGFPCDILNLQHRSDGEWKSRLPSLGEEIDVCPGEGPHRLGAKSSVDIRRCIDSRLIGRVLRVGLWVRGMGDALWSEPFVVLPAFSENESLAIDALLRFAYAEAFFTSRYGRSATLAELMATEYLAFRAINGLEKHGYRFSQVSGDPSQKTWEFKAEPLIAAPGVHSFNVVEDYKVRYQDGAIAPTGRSGKVLGEE